MAERSGRAGWPDPPPLLRLDEGDVHVWRASLSAPSPALAAPLAADERARADRFRFPVDRDRFIAARGILRALLARYLDRDPADLRFTYGPHGKPALAAPAATGGLEFNLSHADDVALVVVARGREVGVDIERVRPLPDLDAVAAVMFSPAERDLLAAAPPDRRPDLFFKLWTHKEAYLKALGSGLSRRPADSTILFGAARSTVADPAWPPDATPWTLCALDVGAELAAALAVAGADWRLTCRQWPE
ncbi:MAG TPA: 4'-phosphopantetheinyl transferase superfamily protein [Thermomicrobiales bacterium]|nr:4'-phosphopantetheinyl transferase superfamily protein [Thermomicrobiales bacterium]